MLGTFLGSNVFRISWMNNNNKNHNCLIIAWIQFSYLHKSRWKLKFELFKLTLSKTSSMKHKLLETKIKVDFILNSGWALLSFCLCFHRWLYLALLYHHWTISFSLSLVSRLRGMPRITGRQMSLLSSWYYSKCI